MTKRAQSFIRVFALSALVLALGGAPAADAALIDVLVESSQGSGIFDVVLGQVGSFDDSSQTAVQSYNRVNFSYAGDEITPVGNTSQMFFVVNTNGLNFYWVHSGAGGGIGSSNTTVELMDPLNNNDPMGYAAVDDAASDTFAQAGDVFTQENEWLAGFSDGFAIGALNQSLSSGWMLLANFDNVAGLTGWQVTSGPGGSNIDLASELGSGATVKFQLNQIPEPGTIALFGLGLVGLFGLRRKPRN